MRFWYNVDITKDNNIHLDDNFYELVEKVAKLLIMLMYAREQYTWVFPLFVLAAFNEIKVMWKMSWPADKIWSTLWTSNKVSWLRGCYKRVSQNLLSYIICIETLMTLGINISFTCDHNQWLTSALWLVFVLNHWCEKILLLDNTRRFENI
jgi:hypothetical protein